MVNTSQKITAIKGYLKSGFRSPPVMSESLAMESELDLINDLITEELALSGHSAAYSTPPRPLPPVQPPPQAAEQRMNLNTGPQLVNFEEEETEASVTPGISTSGACAGAGRLSRSISEPYRMRIDENKSGTVSTGVGSISRQISLEPYVVIEEQPDNKRFRYDKPSDLQSAGVIYGVRTNKAEKKYTYPAIRIGHDGPVKVTVSLVCAEPPYRVHPNGLLVKNKPLANNEYICVKYAHVTRKNCIVKFKDLGIRLVKSTQVEEALNLRALQKVDPFNQGYGKRNFSASELQKVRLCFQVELMPQRRMLPPLVSDVITDTQRAKSLEIAMLCTCSGCNKGGPHIILICKQLNKNDVEVVFYEEEGGRVVWERSVRSSAMLVFGGTIVCAAPAYTRATLEYGEVVIVNVKLRRPSDGKCSAPREFIYHADNAQQLIKKKRKQTADLLQQYVKEKRTPPESLSEVDYSYLYDQDWRNIPGPFDVNSAASSASTSGGFSFTTTSSEYRPMQSNIPMSPEDWRNMPGPFDVNSAASSASTSGGFSFTTTASEYRPMQPNIPMSPDVESIPSISQPMSAMSVAEDDLIIL